MSADLHIHSVYSDGSFTPQELIDMAQKKGLKTVALADHDTVEGVEKMIKKGNQKGIEVIPAIELSTFKEKAEIHILGYYIDYNLPDLLRVVKSIFDSRLERARKMVEKLNNIGIKVEYQDVEDIAGDKYVGRPHIARALVNAGYIDEMGEAFTEKYIGNGGQAYVPKFQLTPEEAINIILKAGGIPVLGHPYFINKGEPFNAEDIQGLVKKGLAGIEVYHSKHDNRTSMYYLQIARKLNLLVTGGSDFHGENSPGVELGDVTVSDKEVVKLKKRKKSKSI